MSMLHGQRHCWCGENHSFEDTVLLNFDHLETVRQAEILAPYEMEAADEETVG